MKIELPSLLGLLNKMNITIGVTSGVDLSAVNLTCVCNGVNVTGGVVTIQAVAEKVQSALKNTLLFSRTCRRRRITPMRWSVR